MNTYIRAAASFCDKNTLVKVCRVCRVWSEPEPDGLGLGLPYRRRRKTMFVSFKNIHEGDKLSVFDGDSEFHYTADEDAAEERDALRKNDSNWSVNVTDDNGRTKKLFPSDFAPYIIYLSVVKKGDWRGSNLVFESVFNSSEDIIRGIRSIFERHVKDESCRRLSGAERISDMAKKYLNTPYVWGGATPKGFDCSGLMQYVYKQNGINISRTSQEQFKNGTAIDKSNLQPGDLVFFKGSDGTASAPGHVGMYIGNNQYIRAPKTGDVVKISNLSGRGDYVGARRITK